MLNPLTPGAFCKKCVFWTFWWCLGWISAKLASIWPKVHLQHDSLPFFLAFHDIWTWACAVIKFLDCFFRLSVFSFSFLFAAVIDLLLGLLAVKKASLRQAIFTMEQPGVVAGNFGRSFSLNFLSIFVHISGSIRPITLIWVSLNRSFPPAEVEYR